MNKNIWAIKESINDMDLTDKQCKCGCEIYYSNEFDAIFCPECNKWLERKCGGNDCRFCSRRPEKPLVVG